MDKMEANEAKPGEEEGLGRKTRMQITQNSREEEYSRGGGAEIVVRVEGRGGEQGGQVSVECGHGGDDGGGTCEKGGVRKSIEKWV